MFLLVENGQVRSEIYASELAAAQSAMRLGRTRNWKLVRRNPVHIESCYHPNCEHIAGAEYKCDCHAGRDTDCVNIGDLQRFASRMRVR